MKNFIITVDTEGDNLWNINNGISTKNTKYIPRFQELCEKYGFKPVYLMSYEIINDTYFVEYINNILKRNVCEVGMHLHAWSNPPYYKLNGITKGRPYLVEYPENIMEEKIKIITQSLEDEFCKNIVSHRAGRWTTNHKYFEILSKYGYKIDCSVTPHVSWGNNLGESGIGGSDYTNFSEQPYYIYDGILEVPMTIRNVRTLVSRNAREFLKNVLLGKKLWMRPLDIDIRDMLTLANIISMEKETNYLEFMIHSSELMPSGSDRFKSQEDIDAFYNNLEGVFNIVSKMYKGCTFLEYVNNN